MFTQITNVKRSGAEAKMAAVNTCVGGQVSGWAAGGKETLK
jgi:hypothetical protein